MTTWPEPSPPCIPWQSWAPPLDPPTPGGLPEDQAQCIADAWWDDSPHLAAAMMWEAYAAMLPPASALASVSTGAQNVSYSPASPGGDLGAALSRAAWHRSFVTGEIVSIPLRQSRPHPHSSLAGGWWDWWDVGAAP
jgi:hypothetical protein